MGMLFFGKESRYGYVCFFTVHLIDTHTGERYNEYNI